MPKSRSGYDASRGTTLRTVVRIAGIVPLLMGGGCKGEFTGPYPCETGYESCINPQANYCETDVTSTAAHCGSCDKSCEVGALCVNSRCQTAAQKLTTLQSGVVPIIAVNSSGVYWASPDESKILSVPLNGGTASTVVSNVNICGNTALPFALSDGALAYLSNNGVACSTGPICTGLLSLPIPGTTPALIASSSLIGNVGCPTSMALDRNRVYWLQKQNNGSAIMSVSLSDSSVATLVSFQGNTTGGLALTDKSVLFATSDNGPPQLQTVPITNANSNLSPTKIVTTVDGKSNGFLAFAVNNEYAFLATGGCPCNGKDTQEVPPSGTIYRHPLSGGEGVAIASFQGLVNSMALDAKFIYFATEATIWKAPIAGGAATRLADNLAAGSSPFVCSSNSCYTPNTATVSIAVDDQYVYFADTSASVNAIFKAKK